MDKSLVSCFFWPTVYNKLEKNVAVTSFTSEIHRGEWYDLYHSQFYTQGINVQWN